MNALGDRYESPSQYYTVTSQALQMTNEELSPTQPQPTVEVQGNGESLKKLSEFIQRRKILNNFEMDEPEPESVPFSAEMGKYITML